MKHCFLKMAGVATILSLMQTTGFAQDDHDQDTTVVHKHMRDRADNSEEIIIKRKNDKDSKLTIEVKDGKVWVNGKPLDEFNDENVSIEKRKFSMDDDMISAFPKIVTSPFRGGAWNYSGDQNMEYFESNTAFLGVSSIDAENSGAEVTEVTSGSAAEKIGLKKGDVIKKIGERTVSGPASLSAAIRKYKPQDKVLVTFQREGKEQKVTTTLGKSKAMNLKSFKVNMPKLKGLTMVTPEDGIYSWDEGRPRLGIRAQDTEEGKGVKVLEVDEDSPADKAGIKEGDIITQFDGKDVNSAEALSTAARESKTKYSMKVKLDREGKTQELEVKIPRKLKTADL